MGSQTVWREVLKRKPAFRSDVPPRPSEPPAHPPTEPTREPPHPPGPIVLPPPPLPPLHIPGRIEPEEEPPEESSQRVIDCAAQRPAAQGHFS